uniref:Prolamin-like domain-containing protein n=1 Tax=Nelumbo nucifera TaxID=4432 RepID=A0A822YZD3_NELNU|nr:TPA_asm: hypothetical protein HUJ06_008528 [Nelumbo nucifera]
MTSGVLQFLACIAVSIALNKNVEGNDTANGVGGYSVNEVDDGLQLPPFNPGSQPPSPYIPMLSPEYFAMAQRCLVGLDFMCLEEVMDSIGKNTFLLSDACCKQILGMGRKCWDDVVVPINRQFGPKLFNQCISVVAPSISPIPPGMESN